MIERITIIGGGSTGHAAAAWFSLKGLQVTLCDDERFAGRFAQIEEQGGILLRGKERGVTPVHCVTTSLEQAVLEAQLIIVCVVAYRHEEVAHAIAPYLKDGQHILISPGNLGSFIFRKAFRERGMTKNVTVSELEGNIFPARLTGKAEATVGMPFRKKKVASLPGSDTKRVVEALDGVYGLVPGTSVFDCALNNNNFVIHLGATLLSASMIEEKRQAFNLFTDGLKQPAFAVAERVREERLALFEAAGITERSNPLIHMNKLIHPDENPQLDVFRTLGGPDSMSHRYLTEDALCCGALAVSLGERLGVRMPVLKAIVILAGAVNGQDYLETGRTLENLGFPAGMSYEEIKKAISQP